jgi:hypothetical protein
VCAGAPTEALAPSTPVPTPEGDARGPGEPVEPGSVDLSPGGAGVPDALQPLATRPALADSLAVARSLPESPGDWDVDALGRLDAELCTRRGLPPRHERVA